LKAVVEQRKQIVGHNTFERVIVREAQAYPKPVKLWTTQEGLAFRLEVVRELADEINGAHFGKRNLFVLAVGSEDVDGVKLAESRRTEIAAEGFLSKSTTTTFLCVEAGARFFKKSARVERR